MTEQQGAEEHVIGRIARKIQGVEDKIDDNKAGIARNADFGGTGVKIMDRLVQRIEVLGGAGFLRLAISPEEDNTGPVLCGVVAPFG